MVVKNKVKALRRKANLSQSELAALCRTSQQQIARIESGSQNTRYALALNIAEALGNTVETVFPKAQRATLAFKKLSPQEKSQTALGETEITKKFEAAGIDVDPRHHFFQGSLTNGQSFLYSIDSATREFLRPLFREKSPDQFIIFDSNNHRVVLNRDCISYVLLGYESHPITSVTSNDETGLEEGEGSVDLESTDGIEASIKVHLTSRSKPFVWEVEYDQAVNDLNPEMGPLNDLMFWIDKYDSSDDDAPNFYFVDVDGDEVFVRPQALMLMTLPLAALGDWEALDDDDEE